MFVGIFPPIAALESTVKATPNKTFKNIQNEIGNSWVSTWKTKIATLVKSYTQAYFSNIEYDVLELKRSNWTCPPILQTLLKPNSGSVKRICANLANLVCFVCKFALFKYEQHNLNPK